MPVRVLVAGGELFGIAENSVRVTLARLHRSGLVERDRRARYRLGNAAAAVQRRVACWRRLDDRVRLWEGGWLAAHTAGVRPLPGRAARRRQTRGLRLLGFRELKPGLAVRPDNLAAPIQEIRAELQALGLAPGIPVFAVAHLDAHHEMQARRLWDAETLVDGYRASCEALRRSAARLGRLEQDEALVESFQLGGRVIRQLVLDPLLPEPIVAAKQRSALLSAMLRYDRLGRACWTGFLKRFDGPERRPGWAREQAA